MHRFRQPCRVCGYHRYPANLTSGGLEVACWPLIPKFAGSNPAEAVGFFRTKKILNTPSFGREVNPFVPCRRFTACKRSLNVAWKSGIFRQNSSAISRPCSSSFHYWGLWWRHLAVEVWTTKGQGLYNKPSDAVHPGALAAGTLPQYNTITNVHRTYKRHSPYGKFSLEMFILWECVRIFICVFCQFFHSYPFPR